MIEQEILKKAGLSDNEAKVYLACLELGTTTVLKINRQTGIKRATIYLTLDSLLSKGLVKKVPKKTTTLYAAEEPKKIAYKLEESLRDFNELLPVFEAKLKRTDKPKITYYEGKDALWDLIINEIFPAETIYFSSTSVKEITKVYPTIFDIWREKFLPHKNSEKILDIVGNEKEDLDYAYSEAAMPYTKFLPAGKKFYTDIIVADNRLFIISYKNLFAIGIESADIVKSFKTIVELAWQSAIPVKK